MSKTWSFVNEQDAILQAGSGIEIIRGDAVTYALGSDALVIIVDSGDRPSGNAVSSASEMTLRAPFPGQAGEWLINEESSAPPMIGFVRMPTGCLAVGRLVVTGGWYEARRYDPTTETWKKGLPKTTRLEFERLPTKLLDQVRAAEEVPLVGIDWVAKLQKNRVDALRSFINTWYADSPIGPATTVEAPMGLPSALLSFYELAAVRPELLGRQDFILPPGDLEYTEDEPFIMIAHEGQGIWEAFIDPADEDPVVWYDDGSGERMPERETLSGFLLQFALGEAAMTSPFRALATTSPTKADDFTTQLTRVPLQARRVPGDPTQLYVAPGLVALTTPNPDNGIALFVGARQRFALKQIERAGFTWEFYDG